jgi:DNA-binding transcriptional LysR family regulator
VSEAFQSERDAELFLAVVDTGAITAAAAVLRIAQPSLSQAVRVLEQRAGRVLFERTPHGTVPTAEGRALEPVARAVLARGRAAREAVREVTALRAGVLRLVAHAAVTAHPLAPAVGEFRRRRPAVSVCVEDAHDDADLVRSVVEGRTELAVVHLPLPGSDGLTVEELGVDELSVAFPPGTLVAPGAFPRAGLSDVPLVALRHGESGRPAVREALDGMGLRAGVVTARWGSVIPLVVAGAGAALVGPWYAERIADLGGVVRPLDPPVRVPFGVLHRREPLTAAPAEFLRVLRAVSAPQRPDQTG